MCDVLLGGIPGCATQCDRGSKLAKNSVTYFMDGPKSNSIKERWPMRLGGEFAPEVLGG